jgi:hypothetical protein
VTATCQNGSCCFCRLLPEGSSASIVKFMNDRSILYENAKTEQGMHFSNVVAPAATAPSFDKAKSRFLRSQRIYDLRSKQARVAVLRRLDVGRNRGQRQRRVYGTWKVLDAAAPQFNRYEPE